MSSKPTASMMERRHPETRHIDTLATLDMLTLLHKDNRQIADAVGACLPEVARLVDNAAAALSRGGRLVIVGAGASGRAALQTVSEYTPEEKHSLVGLIAGGPAAALQEMETAANDYDLGTLELQAIRFSSNDMLLALTVSGQTPWVWGAMRHAWSLGAPIAVLTQQAESEAAQQILTMLTTGLAIRSGRVYSNLRVDLQATSPRWTERQIAIVMTATDCSRSEAKAALASCNQHVRTAILMLMTGLDAWQARDLLAENNDRLRLALQETKRSTLSRVN